MWGFSLAAIAFRPNGYDVFVTVKPLEIDDCKVLHEKDSMMAFVEFTKNKLEEVKE